MPVIVNTNIASMNALRNLNKSQSSLATSLQRLSSGLRINSAKDDASGLAIVEGLTLKIRGNLQAIRNANDGISLGQTAESALGQLADNIQRTREIAVQASNGSISNSDRSQLQKEIDQLTQEISRIVQTSSFNGTSLLSGGSALTFQIGFDGVSSNQLTVATTDLTAASGGTPEATAAQEVVDGLASVPNSSQFSLNAGGANAAIANGAVGSGGTSTTSSTIVFTSSDSISAAAVAVFDAAKAVYNSGGGQDGGVTTADLVAAAQTVADTYQPATSGLNSYNSNLIATSTIDVSTQAAAIAALSSLDADITNIANTRATFGALQNRFEAVVSNLQSSTESYSATRSRIQDADFASETANLSRNQILQQAGISVLSQANNMPQIALSLLQ